MPGSIAEFLAEWATATGVIGGNGHVILPTSNHDFPRLVAGARTADQARAAFVFVLTWPTLPAMYYGDEIGMQYQPGPAEPEGSVLGPPRAGYNRAGSRTPMQWDAADPEVTYLPPHPSPERPNVADSQEDPDSLLNLVRELIALRKANPSLGSAGKVEILNPGYPFVYRRSEFTVAVNPSFTPATADIAAPGELVLGRGAGHENGRLHMDSFSYAVYRDELTPAYNEITSGRPWGPGLPPHPTRLPSPTGSSSPAPGLQSPARVLAVSDRSQVTADLHAVAITGLARLAPHHPCPFSNSAISLRLAVS